MRIYFTLFTSFLIIIILPSCCVRDSKRVPGISIASGIVPAGFYPDFVCVDAAVLRKLDDDPIDVQGEFSISINYLLSRGLRIIGVRNSFFVSIGVPSNTVDAAIFYGALSRDQAFAIVAASAQCSIHDIRSHGNNCVYIRDRIAHISSYSGFTFQCPFDPDILDDAPSLCPICNFQLKLINSK